MKSRAKGKPVVLRPRSTRFVELFRTTPPKTVCPNFYVLSHANGCAFQPHCDLAAKTRGPGKPAATDLATAAE